MAAVKGSEAMSDEAMGKSGETAGKNGTAWRVDCITAEPVHAEAIVAEPVVGEPIVGEPIVGEPILAGEDDLIARDASRRSDGQARTPLGEASLNAIYGELLRRVGEDPTRDGLLRTPDRMEKSLEFLTRGV